MIKLLAMDLDGTLLNDERVISQENLKAVRGAIDKGVVTILNSGRGYTGGVIQHAHELGLKDVPVIACNGAEIRHINTGERIFGTYLDNQILEKLDLLAVKYGFASNFYCDDDSLRFDRNNYCSDFFAKISDQFPNDIGYDVRQLARCENVLKAEFTTDTQGLIEKALEDYKALENTTLFYSKYRLEVVTHLADKGQALKRVAELYGFKENEIMAIGDAENDVHMFKYAGCSVAMGQAQNIFKKHAKHVTDDNNHNGVAKAIYKFIGE